MDALSFNGKLPAVLHKIVRQLGVGSKMQVQVGSQQVTHHDPFLLKMHILSFRQIIGPVYMTWGSC